jgi:hypothetical protein
LPLNPDVSDFPVSMNLIVETLEKAGNRSQLDILSDLVTNWDNVLLQGVVMQIQHSAEDIGSGSVILLGVVVDKLRKIHTHLIHTYLVEYDDFSAGRAGLTEDLRELETSLGGSYV